MFGRRGADQAQPCPPNATRPQLMLILVLADPNHSGGPNRDCLGHDLALNRRLLLTIGSVRVASPRRNADSEEFRIGS
jgi:hypothetical protein